MLTPLKQWICDSCGEVIDGPETGFLEWKVSDKTYLKYDFRIVHAGHHSPRRPHGDCFYSNQERGGDTALDSCVGETGLVVLTSWIDPGEWHKDEYKGPSVKSLREWTTIFRRLQLPYFEEARRYVEEMEDERSTGANEVKLYLPEGLKRIVEEHESAVSD